MYIPTHYVERNRACRKYFSKSLQSINQLDANLQERIFRHTIGEVLQLDPYAPREEIFGRTAGGFAAVYFLRSIDEDSPGISAIKTPRFDLATNIDILDRFEKEADVWKNLPRHANILKVLSVFRYNQIPYVRMNYVEPMPNGGSSLSYKLKKNPLNLQDFLALVMQLLDVLEHLESHMEGFCHGDIKPSNILIRDQNIVQLADFGLSKAFTLNDGEDRPILADFNYAAPEVISGRVTPGRHTDIYAVAATAFEMLYKGPPHIFDFDTGKHVYAWGELSIGLMSKYRPDIPVDILNLILNNLSLAPSTRIQSFRDFKAALLGIISRMGLEFFRLETQEYQNAQWISRSSKNRPIKDFLVDILGNTIESATWIDDALIDASHYRGVGNFEKSLILLNEILEEMPDFGPALAGIAHGRFVQGNLPGALLVYLDALSYYDTKKNLIQYDSIGYVAICTSIVQCIVNLPNTNGEIIGWAYRLARKSMKTAPKNAKVVMTLGLIELRLGKARAALETFRKAHAIDPTNRAVRVNIVIAAGSTSSSDETLVEKLSDKYSLTNDERDWVKKSVETNNASGLFL